MGIHLVQNVLDNAPPGLTPAERLVLAVIAISVRDDNPDAVGGLEDATLLRRTGLTAGGVKRALQRLRARGFELRVPIVRDGHHVIGGDGRPVYARRGEARSYRIPEPWRHKWADPSKSREDGGTPSDDLGGTVVPPKPRGRGDGGTQRGDGGTPQETRGVGRKHSYARARAREMNAFVDDLADALTIDTATPRPEPQPEPAPVAPTAPLPLECRQCHRAFRPTTNGHGGLCRECREQGAVVV